MSFYSVSPQAFAGNGVAPPLSPSGLPASAMPLMATAIPTFSPATQYNPAIFTPINQTSTPTTTLMHYQTPSSIPPITPPTTLMHFQGPQTTTSISGPLPTYTLAQEDVQEILTPLPLPQQLPFIPLTGSSPAKINVSNVSAPVVPIDRRGLVLEDNSPQRTGNFVFPPSVVRP